MPDFCRLGLYRLILYNFILKIGKSSSKLFPKI